MTTATVPARQAPATPAPYTVRSLLVDKQAEIIAALPRHIPPAYFLRVCLTAVQKTPRLAQCTSLSFLGAVLQCAQLGLVPDGFLGQAYLIPYENRKKNALEVQFQCGYRGLITLARRSGEISTVGADAVYEKDAFHYTRGMEPKVEHKSFEGDADPGPLVHTYSWYRLKDGGYDLNVMNRRQVHAIRERSQAYRTGIKTGRHDSPWWTDEAWMWKKTSLKQLLKLAPLSVEIQRVTALDDAADRGMPQDLTLLADPSAEPTVLIEGDEITDEDESVIEQPRRQSDQAPTLTDAMSAGMRTVERADRDAKANGQAPMIDRIKDAGTAGSGWAAITDGGLRLWTRDAALGDALMNAKGALRQIVAEPADAEGRRKLTAITA